MAVLLGECLCMGTSIKNLRNLFFLSFFVLLRGCITSGGGAGGSYPAGWNPSFPRQPGTLTCDGTSGEYAEFY